MPLSPGWRSLWKFIFVLSVGISFIGLIGVFGIGGYLATHRPIQPDAEHGFVVSYKYIFPIVYITEEERRLTDYLLWFSVVAGFVAAGAQIRLQK